MVVMSSGWSGNVVCAFGFWRWDGMGGCVCGLNGWEGGS